MYRFVILFALLVSFLASDVYSQQHLKSGYPEVGEPCPSFILHNIAYFPRTQASLDDFKGKWLVLDFWNKNCGSCVESFPTTSAMQKHFSANVQIMMVGIQDQQNQIQPMYARFREFEKLVMPCAFDSMLSNTWGIYSCPHLVIVGPDGIVKGVTNHLDSAQLAELIDGGQPELRRTYHTQNYDDPRDWRATFDGKKPFMIDGNGSPCDTCFLFRSLLSTYKRTDPWYSPSVIDRNLFDSTYRGGRFQALAVSISYLYMFAYLGREGWPTYDSMYAKYANSPVFLLHDSSAVFEHGKDGKPVPKQFCYSVTIPPARHTGARIMEVMQNDLKNYFGFKATFEERWYPCYKIVVTGPEAKARLATKGGPSESKVLIPRVSSVIHNLPVSTLFPIVIYKTGDIAIDETGITGNIDLMVNDIDLEELLRSLRTQGLDLVKGEIKLKTLVIRDP